MQGGFQATIAETLGEFQSRDGLEFAGFHLRTCMTMVDECVRQDPVSGQSGSMEQDLAEVFGGLCCSLASRRVVRTLFFTKGWPLRLMGLLGPPDLRQSTVREFHRDWEAWRALAASPVQDSATKELLRRSSFNDTSTQQFVQAICGGVVVCWPLRVVSAAFARLYERLCVAPSATRESSAQMTSNLPCASQSVKQRGERSGAICLVDIASQTPLGFKVGVLRCGADERADDVGRVWRGSRVLRSLMGRSVWRGG